MNAEKQRRGRQPGADLQQFGQKWLQCYEDITVYVWRIIEKGFQVNLLLDAVHQLRYNRYSRHSDILAGGWSITIEFAMKDDTFFLVGISVSGTEDAVEVIFPMEKNTTVLGQAFKHFGTP